MSEHGQLCVWGWLTYRWSKTELSDTVPGMGRLRDLDGWVSELLIDVVQPIFDGWMALGGGGCGAG